MIFLSDFYVCVYVFYDLKINFQVTIGRGLMENFKRRAEFYLSDFTDGIFGPRTGLKVSGATLSLFFAVILPCVAFGVVNDHNTGGLITAKKALIGQAFGGLLFALFAGQPLVIIATTAPLCLFTSIVFQYSTTLEVDFLDLFAMVGFWNALFLILYSLFDMSTLMRFCTRSTEEIFATFIFFAFSIDAFKQCATSMSSNEILLRNSFLPLPSPFFPAPQTCLKQVLFFFFCLFY